VTVREVLDADITVNWVLFVMIYLFLLLLASTTKVL